MSGIYQGLPPANTFSGLEGVAVDTNAPSGGQPQTVLMSATMLGGMQPNNFRNAIDGGDFTINPWQRGTAFAAIANSLTYTADRWFAVGGASSSIAVNKTANAEVPGFSQVAKVQRTAANANTAALNFGHVVETADSIRFQGQTVVLSFWAESGATFSPTGGLLGVQVVTGTGTDQSAASLVAGTWTGASTRQLQVGTPGVSNVTPSGQLTATSIQEGTNVVNASSVALTSSMQRFQLITTIPALATQIGILFVMTPVGTAGANDFYNINGIQFETVSATCPFATPFEHRDVQVELEICQRYFYQVNEPASTVIVASGMVSATNTELFCLNLPVQMRAAPTVTVTVGSFKSNSATGGVVAATGLTGNATHTVNAVGLTSTGTGTAGQGALLQGGGGAGIIAVSADF